MEQININEIQFKLNQLIGLIKKETKIRTLIYLITYFISYGSLFSYVMYRMNQMEDMVIETKTEILSVAEDSKEELNNIKDNVKRDFKYGKQR